MSAPTVLITGAAGLIGSEACIQFAELGYKVVAADNDMRQYFFGPEASTAEQYGKVRRQLEDQYPGRHVLTAVDIRDRHAVDELFIAHRPDVIVHCAAQPSHDWAAKEPRTDFAVNALGTLNLLQATREFCATSTFIHCSTSKVYGEHPNALPLQKTNFYGQQGGRFDVPVDHPYWRGIDTTMSVDLTKHSLFGVSKLSGDLLVQEYSRYFDIPAAIFRPGCLTGGYHQGTEMHGWLSYLMRCAMTERRYTIYGYDGYQVRCNIHSSDLVRCFLAVVDAPRLAAVYNIGGGRQVSASMREAITMCEDIVGKGMHIDYDDQARSGDHKWWISTNEPFKADYPNWTPAWGNTYSILHEIYEHNRESWTP